MLSLAGKRLRPWSFGKPTSSFVFLALNSSAQSHRDRNYRSFSKPMYASITLTCASVTLICFFFFLFPKESNQIKSRKQNVSLCLQTFLCMWPRGTFFLSPDIQTWKDLKTKFESRLLGLCVFPALTCTLLFVCLFYCSIDIILVIILMILPFCFWDVFQILSDSKAEKSGLSFIYHMQF